MPANGEARHLRSGAGRPATRGQAAAAPAAPRRDPARNAIAAAVAEAHRRAWGLGLAAPARAPRGRGAGEGVVISARGSPPRSGRLTASPALRRR